MHISEFNKLDIIKMSSLKEIIKNPELFKDKVFDFMGFDERYIYLILWVDDEPVEIMISSIHSEGWELVKENNIETTNLQKALDKAYDNLMSHIKPIKKDEINSVIFHSIVSENPINTNSGLFLQEFFREITKESRKEKLDINAIDKLLDARLEYKELNNV